MPPEIEKRSKQYLIFRLLIVLMGFGLVTLYQFSLGGVPAHATFTYLYAVLGFYLSFAIGLFLLYEKWRKHRAILQCQVWADLVIQSLLIWGTGGGLSVFSPLLFVTVVAATSMISTRGALSLATAANLILILTTLAHGLGISPGGPSSKGDWLTGGRDPIFVITYLLGSVAALYAVSALGSRLSHGLRSMESIQSAVLENMAEGLIAIDSRGRLVLMNKEARKLLKIPEGAERASLERLLPTPHYDCLREALSHGRRRRFNTVLKLPGENEKPVEVKISSTRDDLGHTRYRIGLVSDMSLRREVEAAEQRIQKLEDLQVMSLGIAHEIRNPLASIRGCVQEIGRLACGDAQVKKYMEIACRESDRLDRVLESFLAYARSGPLDLAPVDLVEILEEFLVLLKTRPDFDSRTIVWTPPADRPKIFGDRTRLLQVFLNLGLNALEATSPVDGKVSVTCRHRRFTPIRHGNSTGDLVPGVEVEIGDNGKGIPAREIERLFTPFFTTKTGGNGLGLCIVDRIVREHLGVVGVSSDEGRGTAFRMWFPLIGVGSAEPEPLETPVEQEDLELCTNA